MFIQLQVNERGQVLMLDEETWGAASVPACTNSVQWGSGQGSVQETQVLLLPSKGVLFVPLGSREGNLNRSVSF